MPCSITSQPEDQWRDLKPSQCSGTTGMPISSSSCRAVPSTSSPMTPVAQEVATKITRGSWRSNASLMASARRSTPPNTMSRSPRFVQIDFGSSGFQPRRAARSRE